MKTPTSEATLQYLNDELRGFKRLNIELLVEKLDLQKRIAELEGLLARRDTLLTDTEKELAEYQAEFSDVTDVGIDTGPPRRPTFAELDMAAESHYTGKGL